MSYRILAIVGLTLLVVVGTVEADDKVAHDPQLEQIPPEEAAQIENIVRLTLAQMKKRYSGETPVLRGVHPKDHGCVMATFRVLDTLPEDLRVGVFAKPGLEYQAWIRFSNAAVLAEADSSATDHGSRGMAIKLLKVEGTSLLKKHEPLTQDFLMVNHPVFAFANVEDYEALSEVLLNDSDMADKADRFFADRIKMKDGKPDMTIPMTQRAVRTAGIIKQIRSLSIPPAYQTPPASPADNQYFSAAPYLFGRDMVMKYSAKPSAPSGAAPNVADQDYLRKALLKRLTGADAKEIVFEFQVQVRTKADLAGKIETEIEDASFEWDEKKYPFVTVARIVIPPQDFNTDERKRQCENLFFTPWQGVVEHQPIGGINRLKLGVYEASSAFRHLRK
ncbi:MAG: catalase family protein [Planctomycetaceae bacterium]|nr:catalase family protein [Planctomycetaceae bacterium]